MSIIIINDNIAYYLLRAIFYFIDIACLHHDEMNTIIYYVYLELCSHIVHDDEPDNLSVPSRGTDNVNVFF